MSTRSSTTDLRLALEAALPLGDRWYTRAEKAKAVRRVLLERYSYRRAGRECGASDHTVARWVGDTEERLRLAKEAQEHAA